MSVQGDLGHRSLRPKSDVAEFLTSAEDGVYQATGLVAHEAKAVERIAHGVEEAAQLVEHEVDKVENFVHKLDLTSQEMEARVSKLDTDAQAVIKSKASTPTTQMNGHIWASAKDIMDMGWQWNMFRIFIVLVLFFIIMLHTWNSHVGSNLSGDDTDGHDLGSSTVTSFTILNVLAINIGPLLKIIKLVKSVLSSERRVLGKIEDEVDEVATDVQSTARVIEGAAEVVEHVSHKVEEDAEQLQAFIQQMKTSSESRASSIR